MVSASVDPPETETVVCAVEIPEHGYRDVWMPGFFAMEAIPARGPERNFTKAERERISQIGRRDKCHQCGSIDTRPPMARSFLIIRGLQLGFERG